MILYLYYYSLVDTKVEAYRQELIQKNSGN